MKKFIFLTKIVLIFISVAFIFSVTSDLIMGQNDDDNPNLDRPVIRKDYTLPPTLFSPMAPVTIDDYDNFYLGVDFAEGNISENPNNPLWYFAPYNINGTHYTLNGYDWLVNNPSFANSSGDPVTAYDSLGNLYYDNMKSPITGTWCVKSTNGGVTWQTPVSANVGNDKNWIAADQTAGPYSNYVYGVMTPGNVVRSTNLGASFSTMTTMSTQSTPGMMVCVGPNGSTQGGSVYVVTHSGSTPPTTYTFYRSTNGGVSYTNMGAFAFNGYVGTYVSGRNSVENMRTRPYPFIAADNSYGTYRGRLYLVYAMNNPAGSGNKPNIYCRYSTNGGSNWSDTVKVNDDPNTQNHHQWHPAIWCDKETGKLYVQWMDTRDCPTNDSALIYASYSTNGGVSFVQNQKISNQKMKINCSTCGGGGTPRYQGDYNGVVSNKKVSMLSWADFRAGSFASYVAYFPDFAMRLTPSADSVNSNNGSITFTSAVPSVKLYSDTVIFSYEITPTPATGTLTVTFPSGNKLSTFPGSIPVKVQASGGVTQGTYTLTITGKGPNGTPVHKRASTIYVSGSITGIVSNENINDYKLYQNYPNPFNPVTKIDYNILYKSDVKITIYNSLGKSVTEYNMKSQEPGKHFVIFIANGLSSGVYYYKISAGEFTDVKKMLLIK